MKFTFLLYWILTTASRPLDTTGIYSYTVTSPEGMQYSLSGFQGKKLWLVILPTTQTGSDSAYLQRIDSIAAAHRDQLQAIAVPSIEDGYTADSASRLLHWYQHSLNNSILLSQPLYTHKSSGSQQEGLFRWLTSGSLNNHFDNDVGGPGSTFFVSGKGELYGVFGPEAKNSDRIISLMLP
jgi:hypothetical protein